MPYFDTRKAVFLAETPESSVGIRPVFKVNCWEKTFTGNALWKKKGRLPERARISNNAI
jgi:hypothetical protein